MPGKIKVKVLAGRNLPVMDRASDTTDAFVEIKFGGVTHKTDVCRKSLNPHWNSAEWYRFEVDESELQDEPLQLRLMDHDTYSANDAIGKVVISLAPLLAKESISQMTKRPGATHGGAVMSGWIPVFDTMHGIRGELNIIVKVELFSDFNKYKTSSCGVQFFHCPSIPPGYRASAIHGFVEELVVNDDPEYQWIDKIRTPRASNEARQVAFIKLSNQVQRLVGLKAAELGANAVVGYQQDFDLEGEAGVVARAIGTAVSITPLPTPSQTIAVPPCSQQQLKKYLDILATDNENVTDLNEYFQTHQDQLQKLVHILHPKRMSAILDDPENVDEDEKSLNLTRQSSIKSYTDGLSIFQDNYASQNSFKTLSKDQTDLNRLLSRKNEDSDSDSSGPLQKIKRIKNVFFTKRLGSLRSRKNEKVSDDQISIKSNSSDTSRISLTDLKNEFQKLKRLKKPKFGFQKAKTFKNVDDQGVGMASILARSVIHAQSSLACIAETQDSEHSPSSTLRRTSESEPTLSTPEELSNQPVIITEACDIENEPNRTISDVKYTSLNNIAEEPSVDQEGEKPRRKFSVSCPTSPVAARLENLLKLPGETGYFGSISSALSGDSSEIYSSSEEDDESSDLKTDTDKSIETTSSVVKIVLNKRVDPAVIAHMERKLSVVEGNTEPDTIKHQNTIETALDSDKSEETRDVQGTSFANPENKEEMTASTSTGIEQTCVAHKPNNSNNHFKFHIPFTHKKSLSAPSSPVEKKGFVYRSSKRIKRQLSKISNSSMIKSISHYSLIPKKHNLGRKAMSRPSSTSDVPAKENSRETVLGSPFLSYVDLLSIDKESEVTKPFHKSDDLPRGNVEMYIGSEPASRASVSGISSPYHGKEDYQFHEQTSQRKEKYPAVKPTGLVHTAMETILMDKVQSLLMPTSPEPNAKEQQFFDDVNQKLEVVEEAQNKNGPSDQVLVSENTEETIEKESKPNHKRLTRQDSIHSTTAIEQTPPPVSNETVPNIVIPCKPLTTPMLQHFHPILSGANKTLETIPSLPESSSVDRPQSLDIDGLFSGVSLDERGEADGRCMTNSVSVCDNSHAACVAVVGRSDRDKDKGSPKHSRHESYGRDTVASSSANAQNSSLNATSTPVGMHRRSSDSDLSITPKGSSLNASGNNGSGGGAILKPSMNSNNLDLLEYPFLTMSEYPPGFIVHIGGCVCARSVKLIDGGGDSASRAPWWAELRTELRAHARALRCNAVIAYCESAAICEDVCVLSASGTAAVINLDCDFNADLDSSLTGQAGSKTTIEEVETDNCCIAHVPYSPGAGPYPAELAACGGCRRARVPSVLLATCSKPNKLAACNKSVILTAVAARARRAAPASEPGARDISDQLPFLEYELHKLLLAKLRMQGANALFDLHTQIAVGERCVLALASGHAYRLGAIAAPTPPTIKSSENDKDALELQKALWDTFTANKLANGYDQVPEMSGVTSVSENEDPPALELSADKDAALLEIDEAEDVETARALSRRRPPLRVMCGASKAARTHKPHAFAQVIRARLPPNCSAIWLERCLSRSLDALAYKLRSLQPHAVARHRLNLELPEDEIQIVLSGTAIKLADPSKPDQNGHHDNANNNNHGGHGTGDAEDEIFALDEEQSPKPQPSEPHAEENKAMVTAQTPPSISLTSLSAVWGARGVRRVCALRLLFVRETTAVRELGGLSGFLHTFTCEVLAIVRAYTAALGGNTLTSFYITQLMLQDNAHKNQGQCLLSVGGDVVHITY